MGSGYSGSLRIRAGLFDRYLVEPVIWRMEFVRVDNQSSPFAIRSEELVTPERRR